jgi:hypothetical protein
MRTSCKVDYHLNALQYRPPVGHISKITDRTNDYPRIERLRSGVAGECDDPIAAAQKFVAKNSTNKSGCPGD